MRLFARVLCLEGYDELAADATAALKGLIDILGDPDETDALGEESKGECGADGEHVKEEKENHGGAEASSQQTDPAKDMSASSGRANKSETSIEPSADEDISTRAR